MKMNETAIPEGLQTPVDRRSLLKWLAAASVSGNFAGNLLAQEPTPTASRKPDAGDRQMVFIAPDDRRHAKLGSNQIAFKLASEDSASLIATAELVLESGTMGAAPHLHHGLDEICRVLEGTVHVFVDGKVTAVPAGGWHLRPRGLVHSFWNSGPKPAKCIEIYVPGGHERYMQDLADLFVDGRRPQRAEVEALAKKHDIEWHFDQLEDLTKRYNVRL
jgi:mannose-6-phosphate isomerase-like protein (cupin superfamily)